MNAEVEFRNAEVNDRDEILHWSARILDGCPRTRHDRVRADRGLYRSRGCGIPAADGRAGSELDLLEADFELQRVELSSIEFCTSS